MKKPEGHTPVAAVEDRLDTFAALLLKWSKMGDLTAFRSREKVMALGVQASLFALPFLPKSGRVLDIGSGGGIPAIPLALKTPGVEWTLCEPSPPKTAFLREACGALKISPTIVESDISALLARDNRPWDAITVRGLRLSRGLVKRLRSALSGGGKLVVWSGGPRAALYAGWMQDLGLSVESSTAGETNLSLIVGTR